MQQPKGLRKTNFLDYSILVPYLALAVIGLVMVFSVTVPAQLSAGQNIYRPVIVQTGFFIFSLLFMILLYRLKLRTFRSSALLAFFVPVEFILLIVARFSRAVNGAHGWIQIPGGLGTIQPAELLKIFLIWYLSSVFFKRQDKIGQEDMSAIFEQKKWYENIMTGWRLPTFGMLLLVLIMPDLGNAVIIVSVIVALVIISGVSIEWTKGFVRWAVLLISLFFAALYATGGNLIPGSYTNNRFKAFIDPFAGLSTYGHQLANSYYAISNGGWFGRGLGESIEKKGYLPEASTDFIFPIVIEELGLIGGLLILGLLFFMILRIMLVGIRAKDPFNSMIAIGVGVVLTAQTFVNVGGAIGLIPETGVTFPFLSQGGSSLLVLSIAIALVLNVSANERLVELNELSYHQSIRREKSWNDGLSDQ